MAVARAGAEVAAGRLINVLRRTSRAIVVVGMIIHARGAERMVVAVVVAGGVGDGKETKGVSMGVIQKMRY